MAQQYASGQSGYRGLVSKAASSLVEGENRSKGKKDNDLVTQLEGEAVKAIGAKLLTGDATSSSHPKRVGELVNNLSSWHQGRNENQGMSNFDGYNERGNNPRGGYDYNKKRTGNYGGARGYGYESQGYGGDARWSSSGINGNNAWDRPVDTLGVGRQGYYSNNGYEDYGSRGTMNDGYYSNNGYDSYRDRGRTNDACYSNNSYEGYGSRGRMNDGYYSNNGYEGYGDRGRMNDGYDRWNNNPQGSRSGYGYM